METNKKFNQFDRVLAKSFNGKWKCSFYSHWDEGFEKHITTANVSYYDDEILPYEGNEHLVGTNDEPEPGVKLEEGDIYLFSDDVDDFLNVRDLILDKISRINFRDEVFLQYGEPNPWKYAIRFSDFNPNDMEETKKHILCVKNGKVVRYKG